jgi:nicotinamide riboside kinase
MAQVVALLGAECTGKSTLAEALAGRCGAGLVTEYLREWCEQHGRTPQRAEQAHIAAEQRRRIEAAARRHALVIADTTPLITALCSQHYFDDDRLLAEAIAFQRGCALTLVCAPDLPWQADGIQRDGPAVRAAFDHRLRAALADAGLAYAKVAGEQAGQRLAQAMQAIQTLNP